jgi:CHAT domain-containing protein
MQPYMRKHRWRLRVFFGVLLALVAIMPAAAGDIGTAAGTLGRRGEALASLGQLRLAAGDLEQVLHQAEDHGDIARIAAASGALGNVFLQAHDFHRSRPLLERSLALARQYKLPATIAVSANNLANLAYAEGDFAGAVRAYDESIDAAAGMNEDGLTVTAMTNKARALVAQQHVDQAVPLLEAALNRATNLPASSDKAYALVAIGRLAQPPRGSTAAGIPASRLALSYAALQRAGQLAASLGEARVGSLSYGYLGELYEAAGRRGDAAALAGRAVFLAQQIGAADLLYRWEWLHGRLARADGDRANAIAADRRAVAALQSIRQDIPVDYVDGRSSFRESIGPLYLELTDLLLLTAAEQHGTRRAGLLLREARNTVEALKIAEVRDYFKDPCLAPLEAHGTTGADTSAHTATFYPIVLHNRIELLLAFPDGEQQQVTINIDGAQLTRTVHELRLDLQTLGTRDFFQPAQRLYDWLLRPLEPALAAHKVDTLVIVPDEALRSIPFSALHDGRSFVVEHYAVATELGLTLFDPKPIARQPLRALVAGLSEAVQGYSALPYVTNEIHSISRIASDSMVIENKDFRLARIEQALRTVPYSVVHIASHGEFSNDPSRTYILTYDGRLTLNELEYAIKRGAFRDEPLELLTLSACQTAEGDDRAALGLAGIAIKAGARSAVASLWFINDEAAAQLITLFYDRLHKPGMTKAAALREAQLELMKQQRFRHPGYWSPFLLIGNWL